MRKIIALAAAMTAMVGIAQAQETKTIGVSIPAADHGWTAGVVYHANRVADLLMKEHPGLKVVVKTSPIRRPRRTRSRTSRSRASTRSSSCDRSRSARQRHQGGEGQGHVRRDRRPRPLGQRRQRARPLCRRQQSGARRSRRPLHQGAHPDAQVVVIRGLPIPIDQQRQDGFDKGIAGSNVKVLDRQFGNWNRDDAFRVMQDT